MWTVENCLAPWLLHGFFGLPGFLGRFLGYFWSIKGSGYNVRENRFRAFQSFSYVYETVQWVSIFGPEKNYMALNQKWFTIVVTIVRDFRGLNSIREKYTIAKISMLIIFTILGPYSCILGVFRVFAVFCRNCFSPICEKYTLAKILVGHSRTIVAREIYPVYSN